MARRPITELGRAISAFVNNLITEEEYKNCCVGLAFVSNGKLIQITELFTDWVEIDLNKRGKVERK